MRFTFEMLLGYKVLGVIPSQSLQASLVVKQQATLGFVIADLAVCKVHFVSRYFLLHLHAKKKKK